MVNRAPVTVVIPTQNEAAQIAECVRGLGWADEVIVVDGRSTDGTRELARAAGARVLDGDAVQGPTIAHQRNAGIGAATHEWVFALDADERVGPELSAELAATVAAPAREAYAVRRRNVLPGEPVRHAGWGIGGLARCCAGWPLPVCSSSTRGCGSGRGDRSAARPGFSPHGRRHRAPPRRDGQALPTRRAGRLDATRPRRPRLRRPARRHRGSAARGPPAHEIAAGPAAVVAPGGDVGAPTQGPLRALRQR